MNKIQVNLRAKEFRKNPKGMFLIKPRDLTFEETLRIFEAQIKLQEEALVNYQEVDEESMFDESTYQNVVFFDKINLQFQIEVEDFRIAFEKYDLKNNALVQD